MLAWALFCLAAAFIAALLGFGGFAATMTGLAKVLFFIFLVLATIALLLRQSQKNR